MSKPSDHDGRGYDPPYPTEQDRDGEVAQLRAEVNRLCTERDATLHPVGMMTRGGVLHLFADAAGLRRFWDEVDGDFGCVAWLDKPVVFHPVEPGVTIEGGPAGEEKR